MLVLFRATYARQIRGRTGLVEFSERFVARRWPNPMSAGPATSRQHRVRRIGGSRCHNDLHRDRL